MHVKQGSYAVVMLRLASLAFFLGCAVAVARYYGLGSSFELLGVVIIAFGLMRLLSRRRVH